MHACTSARLMQVESSSRQCSPREDDGSYLIVTIKTPTPSPYTSDTCPTFAPNTAKFARQGNVRFGLSRKRDVYTCTNQVGEAGTRKPCTTEAGSQLVVARRSTCSSSRWQPANLFAPVLLREGRANGLTRPDLTVCACKTRDKKVNTPQILRRAFHAMHVARRADSFHRSDSCQKSQLRDHPSSESHRCVVFPSWYVCHVGPT
jgi:hypothetical protein